MLFEVIRDGRVLMRTEHESCIYTHETLLAMQAAGYKFRMNGRVWKPVKQEKTQEKRQVRGRRRKR